MTRSMEEIVALYAERKSERGPDAERMRLVAQHYNNEIAVPLPEIDKREAPAVANMMAQAIDGHAQRVASVGPDINFPPLRLGVQKDREKARTQRRAVKKWHDNTGYTLLTRKRARHLVAYASAPVLVRPDPETLAPCFDVRSPLDTYPAPALSAADFLPANTCFVFTRSVGWLARRYPMQAAALQASRLDRGDKRGENRLREDDSVEVIEYWDDTQHTLIAVGQGKIVSGQQAEYGIGGAQIINLGLGGRSQFAVLLADLPNLAGVPGVVIPSRITLDRPKGQFDDMPALFQMQAKLMALEVNAVTRAVFPDTWFVHGPNGGEIVRVADGLRGVVGEVRGGALQDMQLQPGFQTSQTIDRLERAMRLNGSMPAEMGGESGTNIRTDRRGQSILSEAIDFYIQEHQEILERALHFEIDYGIEVEKAYFGRRRKSFALSDGSRDKVTQVDYIPNELWTPKPLVTVDYAMVGADINQLTVAAGQGVGMGTLSKLSAARMLPYVGDAEWEIGQVTSEALDTAVLAAIQAQANAGTLTLPDTARLKQLLASGEWSLEDAVIKVHDEAQARQASSGDPGTTTGPVEPGSPAAQPGIAAPGQGQEAPAIAQPPASLDNLRMTLRALAGSQSQARSVQ